MIKDQCNNCRKYNTSSCGQAIVYNSLSCEFYVKKLDLSKPTDKPTSSPVTNPQPQSVPQPVPQPQPQPNSPSNNSISAEPSFWTMLFSFKGRIRRTRYWLTGICTQLLFLPANLADDDMSEGVAIFTLLIFIPAIWVWLANIAKRCHDFGKSGFLGLLLLIPVVNLAIGIYLAFFKGELNDNEYGPSPY